MGVKEPKKKKYRRMLLRMWCLSSVTFLTIVKFNQQLSFITVQHSIRDI